MYLDSTQIVPLCHSLRAGRATSKCLFAGDEVEPVVPEQQPDLVHDLGGRGHPQQGPALAELETKVTIKDRAHICPNITKYICGEKTVMWRNFSFLYRIWTIYGVLSKFMPFCSKSMWRKICAEKICVEKKWQIWGLIKDSIYWKLFLFLCFCWGWLYLMNV